MCKNNLLIVHGVENGGPRACPQKILLEPRPFKPSENTLLRNRMYQIFNMVSSNLKM